MSAQNRAQLAALKALFATVTDEVLATLNRVFSQSNASMVLVRDLVAEERADRALRDRVFAPLAPLFGARPEGPAFPPRMRAAMWSALRRTAPELIQEAAEESRYLRGGDKSPLVFDDLARRAGILLRSPTSALSRQSDATLVAELAGYVALVSLARKTLTMLPDWLGRVSDERVATLKIALRDASVVVPDGAVRLMELMAAHLPEPQLVLRLIAVATDRSGDRFIAESELAHFGERLLADVDRRVERLRAFNPVESAQRDQALAEDITRCFAILAEFERSVELDREGPWGHRVATARRAIAAHVESRLRDVEGAIAEALPMQKVKTSGRVSRTEPAIAHDPLPGAVRRARGLLVLVEASRASVAVGGYGALRGAVTDRVRERLEDYADQVLRQMNGAGPVDAERARVWLELAAEFLERVDAVKSADLVRRRAASALATPAKLNVA